MGACSSSPNSKVNDHEQQGAGAFHQNPAEAQEHFQKALDIKQSNIKKYKSTLGKSYFIIGACLWAQEKDPKIIIESITKGLPYLSKKQQPATSFAYYYLGLAHFKLQQYPEAIHNITESCTHFRDTFGSTSREYAIGLELLGNIYKAQKKFSEALKEYKACAAILSVNTEAPEQKDKAPEKAKEQNIDFIDAVCERLLLGNIPNLSQIFFGMGEISLKLNNPDEACLFFEKAFEALFDKQRESITFNDKLIRQVDLITKLSFEYPQLDEKLMEIVKKWKKMKRLSQKLDGRKGSVTNDPSEKKSFHRQSSTDNRA